MGDEGQVEQGGGQCWLVNEAEPCRSMHELILIERGDRASLLESASGGPVGPVQHLLSCAGFTGGGASKARVNELEVDAVTFEKVMGFDVEADALGMVDVAARRALTGALGGFAPVAHGQSGFHRSEYAFLAAWNAAGKPPVIVLQPRFSSGGDGRGVPSSILSAAIGNRRVLTAMDRFGEAPPDEGEEASTSGGYDVRQHVGPRLTDRVTSTRKLCPICERPMRLWKGTYWCIEALAAQASRAE